MSRRKNPMAASPMAPMEHRIELLRTARAFSLCSLARRDRRLRPARRRG